jgi:hypothetical protein
LYLILCILLITSLPASCAPQSSTLEPKISPFNEIGAYGPFVIESESSKTGSLDDVIVSTDPKIEFDTALKDDNLIVNVKQPLEIGRTYTISLENVTSGSIEYSQLFKVRQPCLAYIKGLSAQANIWKKCADQEAIQLTKVNGQVIEFSPSRNGEWLVYISQAEEGGREIHRINRNGDDEETLVNCGQELCSDAVLDANGAALAYAVHDHDYHLVIKDLQTGDVQRFSGNIVDIQFSPDSQYLSYFDQNENLLKIINLKTRKIITYESGIDLAGSWSQDSRHILFGVYDYWGGLAGVVIFEADVDSGISHQLFGPTESKYVYEYYQPQYTNNPEWLIANVRDQSASFSRQIWMVMRDGSEIFRVSDDPLYNHSAIASDPSFSQIAFQRFKIGTSNSKPQVVVWNSSKNIFEVISEDSIQPQWLP